MMTINVSAHIEPDLASKLEEVAKFEGRSKTYYIKAGLSKILDEKFQDLQDILSARKTLKDAQINNAFATFDEVFKDVE